MHIRNKCKAAYQKKENLNSIFKLWTILWDHANKSKKSTGQLQDSLAVMICGFHPQGESSIPRLK